MNYKVGDRVWVDEGDDAGCMEYGGSVVEVATDGGLAIKVESHPIFHGAPHGSIRTVNGEDAEHHVWPWGEAS